MLKNIFKSFLALLVASSAFLIGFYLGEEKIKSKIPDFQEDIEEKTWQLISVCNAVLIGLQLLFSFQKGKS